MKVLIRSACELDISKMVCLSDKRREAYAKAQPQF
jgi:hypothetical protein